MNNDYSLVRALTVNNPFGIYPYTAHDGPKPDWQLILEIDRAISLFQEALNDWAYEAVPIAANEDIGRWFGCLFRLREILYDYWGGVYLK